MNEHNKISIAGYSFQEICDCLEKINVPQKQINMRAKQLWIEIYNKGTKDFHSITTIAKELRKNLNDNFNLERPEIEKELVSVDGTVKWLVKLQKNNNETQNPVIETVYIPEETRATLCISSQIGCTLNCKFCYTGTQVLVRNLTSQEIVAQVLLAKDRMNDWREQKTRKITNIVFMGMGEPLYNFDNVKKAIQIIKHNDGLCFSSRKITLSTSGVVPEIFRCGKEIDVMLAVSLHATNNELRSKIMPINIKYPIEQLIDACRQYHNLKNSRRITFEYVMLRDINDSKQHAKELLTLIRGIPAKINLIPFNPWDGCEYQCSLPSKIDEFAEIINKAGYASPIRKSRGLDIMAACGQLKSLTRRLPKRQIIKQNAVKQKESNNSYVS